MHTWLITKDNVLISLIYLCYMKQKYALYCLHRKSVMRMRHKSWNTCMIYCDAEKYLAYFYIQQKDTFTTYCFSLYAWLSMDTYSSWCNNVVPCGYHTKKIINESLSTSCHMSGWWKNLAEEMVIDCSLPSQTCSGISEFFIAATMIERYEWTSTHKPNYW